MLFDHLNVPLSLRSSEKVAASQGQLVKVAVRCCLLGSAMTVDTEIKN